MRLDEIGLQRVVENIKTNLGSRVDSAIEDKTSNIISDLNKINFELRLNSYVTTENMKCVFVDAFDSEDSIILTEGKFEEGKIYI